MTDNEIIKALKDLIKQQADGYQTHLEHGGKRDECYEKFLAIMERLIEMFDRQKAEIERLEKDRKENFEMWKKLCEQAEEKHEKMFQEAKATIRPKAIKEFAERLKNKLTACSKTVDGECEYLIRDYDIDNLVKEMVGDAE